MTKVGSLDADLAEVLLTEEAISSKVQTTNEPGSVGKAGNEYGWTATASKAPWPPAA